MTNPTEQQAMVKAAEKASTEEARQIWRNAQPHDEETRDQVALALAENPNTYGDLLHELVQHQLPHDITVTAWPHHQAIIAHPNCQDRTYLHYIEIGGDLARFCAQRGNLQGEVLNQVRADPELSMHYGLNPAATADDLKAAYRQSRRFGLPIGVSAHPNADAELLEEIFEDCLADLRADTHRSHRTETKRNTEQLGALRSMRAATNHPNSPAGLAVRWVFCDDPHLDRIISAIRGRAGEGGWDAEQLRIADDLCREGWEGTLSELAAAVGADLPN